MQDAGLTKLGDILAEQRNIIQKRDDFALKEYVKRHCCCDPNFIAGPVDICSTGPAFLFIERREFLAWRD